MSTHLQLDAEAEARLARRIEAGVVAGAVLDGTLPRPPAASDADLARLERDGLAAFDEFVRANVRLVWYVVNPMAQRSGLDAEELFQEGIVGLLEALRRFDHRLGPFARFALPRIRMHVWDAAATALGQLGLSVRRAKAWRQVRATVASLTMVLGRAPHPAEVADALGRSEASVRELMCFVPADTLEPQVESVLPDRSEEERPRVSSGGLERLLRGLGPLDAAIVRRRYGLNGEPPQAIADIACELRLSESTVRRRERAALGRMQPAAEQLARSA